MKCLLVGDSHLKISILEDSKKFIDQLLTMIRSNSYKYVVLLGDQFDTFAIVRSEILSVWTRFFREVSKTKTQIIALTGNHDLAGAEGGSNPMEPFRHYANVHIITELTEIDGVYFAPFYRDNADFEQMAKLLPERSVLFCHQSIDGCTFENAFYDPHGVNPSHLQHLSSVISGHVHSRQAFKNIWYPGTPFQHTFGDAGQTKYIHEIELITTGYTILKEIELQMPKFEVIEAENIAQIQLPEPSSLTSYKIVAKGSPSEITAFWDSSEIKAFKSQARRVVDSMTSIKPQNTTIKIAGQTHQEKLEHYVRSRQWRSNPNKIIDKAKDFLRQLRADACV